MPKYSGTILNHFVVAEISDWTAGYYVEIDGVKKATGAQIIADKPIILDLDGHQLLIRFSGKLSGHIEIILDGKIIHSA